MNIIHNLAFLLLFQSLFVFDKALEIPMSSPLPDSLHVQKNDKNAAANIVFRSTDDGQTWQDISNGLPKPVQDDYGVYRQVFFGNDNGLYLTAGNELYHSKTNSTVPFWTKESFPDEHSSITPGKTGIFAYNYNGHLLQKTSEMSEWSPIFTNLQKEGLRTVFETAEGTFFIGSDKGLFRSTDSGTTWKQVQSGNWMKLTESNGILIAANAMGIIRSADNGEHWNLVISEGGVGINVERIEGGFAAITFNTQSKTRRVRTSYDGGKTWQPIDAGLPAQLSISSIIQVGKYFFCGHPEGIFRSSDKGKTWKLLLPSIENKVFHLSSSGNVIYAIPRSGGC